jgi:hypothetical protein
MKTKYKIVITQYDESDSSKEEVIEADIDLDRHMTMNSWNNILYKVNTLLNKFQDIKTNLMHELENKLEEINDESKHSIREF